MSARHWKAIGIQLLIVAGFFGLVALAEKLAQSLGTTQPAILFGRTKLIELLFVIVAASATQLILRWPSPIPRRMPLPPSLRYAGWGPFLILAVVVLALLLEHAGSTVSSQIAIQSLLTATFIGAAEELTFRHLAYCNAAPISPAFYIGINMLCFGMLHAWQVGLRGFVVTAIVGACFDLARVLGRPLWVLILAHALIDAVGFYARDALGETPGALSLPDVLLLILVALPVCYVLSRREHWRSADPSAPSLSSLALAER